MHFNYLYFKEEVREGFYIPGLMKRFWAAQMEVLSDVIKLCDDYGIKYFASYGTLLGAVRHKGFIPWDDDIDICMLREDYEKFISIAGEKLAPTYKVKTNFVEAGNLFFLTRVYNSDKISLDEAFLQKFHGFPMLAGIDIFVLDNVYDDSIQENERRESIKALEGKLKTAINNDNDFDCQNIINEMDRLCSMAPKGEKVAAIIEAIGHPNEKATSRNCFDTCVDMQFENMNVKAPAGYDEYLHSLFGEYSRIIKGGGVHQYPAYEKNETVFMNAIEGGSPFKFEFGEEELLSQERPAHKGIIALLKKLVSVLESGANLIQTQNMAITIGESVEKLKGEGAMPVPLLEKCCECIYEMYQNNTSGITDNMAKVIDELKSYINDKEHKKNILIIMSYEEDYPYAKELYSRLMSEGKCVTVIAVPHYERFMNGGRGDGHLTQFKNDIPVTDYRDYDIRKEYPEIIYTFNGYDQTNQTMCLDSAYFTSVLRNYTDELIYIQPFVTDDISDDDEKMKKLMRHYVDIPAMVFADKIIVPNNNQKEVYIKYLCERYGDTYRKVWQDKLMEKSK